MRRDRLIGEPILDVFRQYDGGAPDEQDRLELGTSPELTLRLRMQAPDDLMTCLVDEFCDVVMSASPRQVKTDPVGCGSSLTGAQSSATCQNGFRSLRRDPPPFDGPLSLPASAALGR